MDNRSDRQPGSIIIIITTVAVIILISILIIIINGIIVSQIAIIIIIIVDGIIRVMNIIMVNNDLRLLHRFPPAESLNENFMGKKDDAKNCDYTSERGRKKTIW